MTLREELDKVILAEDRKPETAANESQSLGIQLKDVNPFLEIERQASSTMLMTSSGNKPCLVSF